MLSKTYRQRPSQIYFIKDELTAWSFDRAVSSFGMSVEAAIDKATSKAKTTQDSQRKAQRELEKWLREPGERPKFRDPAAERVNGGS